MAKRLFADFSSIDTRVTMTVAEDGPKGTQQNRAHWVKSQRSEEESGRSWFRSCLNSVICVTNVRARSTEEPNVPSTWSKLGTGDLDGGRPGIPESVSEILDARELSSVEELQSSG